MFPGSPYYHSCFPRVNTGLQLSSVENANFHHRSFSSLLRNHRSSLKKYLAKKYFITWDWNSFIPFPTVVHIYFNKSRITTLLTKDKQQTTYCNKSNYSKRAKALMKKAKGIGHFRYCKEIEIEYEQHFVCH